MNGITAACQGRLAKDLEPIRFTGGGTPFVSFSLAVQDDKRGEDTPTQWIRAGRREAHRPEPELLDGPGAGPDQQAVAAA